MFDAAVASEAIDAAYQDDSQATRAKYVPSDWTDYHPMSWAANWHKWFKGDTSDSRGKMGWPDYFKTALAHIGSVYNYYSTGDLVFMEENTVPDVMEGVFHWPTLNWTWPPSCNLNITFAMNCWQKQESHKGVGTLAGTLGGGWGFHCWQEIVGGDGDEIETVYQYYSAAVANGMVADGSITNNPVFAVAGTRMDDRNASQDEVWHALAEYVPAISSPVGGTPTFGNPDRSHNLNSSAYRNDWGRVHKVYGQSWLHSDMKDMAFYYVYPLYDELVRIGVLK